MSNQLLQLISTQAWQIAALACIVAIMNRTVAKNRPHLAHALWMLVLVKCVTPPIWGHSLGLFSQLQAVWTAETDVFESVASNEPLPMPQEAPLDSVGLVPLAKTRMPDESFEMVDSNVVSAPKVEVAGQVVLSQASVVSKAKLWNPSWPMILLSLVGIGALLTITVMVVRCALCLRHIHRHRTTEFDESLNDQLQLLAKNLRIRRVPQIIVSDVLFGPAVLGLWKHVIVLPKCLLDSSRSCLPGRTFAEGEPARRAFDNTGLPDHTECTQVAASREVLPGREDLARPLPGREDLARPLSGREDLQFLDPILAHELLHIRRGDLRTGTLQAVVQSLWWFHPAVWFCNRRLSREAERCCDEEVIAEFGCSPGRYARSLLSVIESKHKLQPVPVFPGMKPVEITSQRMERIMSLKTGLKKQTPLWCWLAVAALAIVVLPGAGATSQSSAPERPSGSSETDHHIHEPSEVSLAGDKSAVEAASSEIQLSPDALVTLVSETRGQVSRRLLSTDEHTPWQIMSGIEGLRRDMVLKDGDRTVNALEWIQAGPVYQGESWFEKTDHGGRAHPFSKPYWFEGHVNQFFSKLAACQLPLDATFETPDGPITIQDMVNHAKMVVNDREQVSWTLLALCRYLPPDARWTNANGEERSIERLVEVEVGKTVGGPTSPDGGTTGLYALAVARNEYLKTGKPLEGVWLKADGKIKRHIELARSQQNPDGTLSSGFFRRSERNTNFERRLSSTGHLLQFLMHAVSDEQLEQDWIRRAVEATANDIQANRTEYVSCDPLFTSTEALTTYLERVTNTPIGVAVEPQEPDHTSRPVLRTTTDSHTQAVAEPVEESRSERLVLVTYSVAELVVTTTGTAAGADFSRIVELIKATIEPDSWRDDFGLIEDNSQTLSLVIRQTPEAHAEIAKLLSQLRDDLDQVLISCRLMQITADAQLKGLEERCSFHTMNDHKRWALLTKERSESVVKFLTDEKTDVLACPRIVTFSGRPALIEIGEQGERSFGGFHLTAEPRVIANSSVIRLNHAVWLSVNPVPAVITGQEASTPLSRDESLIGSGQTLLLLIETPPRDNAQPLNEQPVANRHVVLLTIEKLCEEEEPVHTTPPSAK